MGRTTPSSRERRSTADLVIQPVLNVIEVEGRDYFLVNGEPLFLNDTNFLDKLVFGPESAAYVGVGYTNVRQRNLCRNANARRVVIITWAAFGLLFFALIGGLSLRRWKASFQNPKPPKERAGCGACLAKWFKNLAAIPTSLFMPVHIVLNILVLIDVWGAWPMWVLLPCIAGPFLISGLLISVAWTRGSRCSEGLGFAFVWPPQAAASAQARDIATSGVMWRLAYAVLLWPFCVLATVAFDLLGLVGRLGGHLTVEGVPLSIRYYQEARSLLQIAVETLPQSVFQSALYILGSSRATRIYVDDITFIASITIFLAGILVNVGLLLKEAFESKEGVMHTWTLVKERFARLALLAQLQAGEGSPEKEPEVEEANTFAEMGA